jgi:TPR repeat protein
LYGIGQDVAQDDAEAIRWFRKAAEQGNALAQFNIGVSYSKGKGVPRDLRQARLWMQKAAAGGNDDAKKWLAAH